jgi:Rps23 Pro-64 3,4-dihydroxylase Tpa1-like proline 4-hydroxylase
MLLNSGPIQYGFFAPESAGLGQRFHQQYASADPFPHIVFDDFLDAAILDQCLREFPAISSSRVGYHRPQENLKFEFKPEHLSPALRSLFYSFNSAPFLGFLGGVTGIKGLIPDPYFVGGGFHLVADGGHLNVHADFNHHALLGLERRINVLIYLNKDWREEYGGSLELWDVAMRGVRQRIIPLFNRCVIFNTSSTSFHGNPEPVRHPTQSPRRSIALYYYTATWDGLRREHSTQFKARPNSADPSVFNVRARELFADIMPPLLMRALTKIRRTTVLARKRVQISR